MKKVATQVGVVLVCVAGVSLVLMFFALSFPVFAVLLGGLAVFFLFIDPRHVVLVSLSLGVATLLVAGGLRVTGLQDSVYYRPDEKYAGDNAYAAGVDVTMPQPHGDLRALSTREDIPAEPRVVAFHTDNHGFRNERSYQGQPFVFVGDSFVAGTGITQPDLLTEQLYVTYGEDVYNLGYPGKIVDYVARMRAFKQEVDADARFILFIFEGNDFWKGDLFPGSHAVSPDEQGTRYEQFAKRFHGFRMYRYFFLMQQRLKVARRQPQRERVAVLQGAAGPMAFLTGSMQVVRRDSLLAHMATEIEGHLRPLQPDIAHIFFIPAKYRVYHHLLDNDAGVALDSLPHFQWELLKTASNRLSIPATDLTPSLIAASDSLLAEGKHTFWRDDTHWNADGIAVAAEVVWREVFSGK